MWIECNLTPVFRWVNIDAGGDGKPENTENSTHEFLQKKAGTVKPCRLNVFN